jgi:hypothetical protein
MIFGPKVLVQVRPLWPVRGTQVDLIDERTESMVHALTRPKQPVRKEHDNVAV